METKEVFIWIGKGVLVVFLLMGLVLPLGSTTVINSSNGGEPFYPGINATYTVVNSTSLALGVLSQTTCDMIFVNGTLVGGTC